MLYGFDPELVEVLSVHRTLEEEVYMVGIVMRDDSGYVEETVYCSRPDDPFGLAPQIRERVAEWIAEHGEPPMLEYDSDE